MDKGRALFQVSIKGEMPARCCKISKEKRMYTSVVQWKSIKNNTVVLLLGEV